MSDSISNSTLYDEGSVNYNPNGQEEDTKSSAVSLNFLYPLGIVPVVVTFVLVLLRLYIRGFIKRNLNIEDFLVVAAWIFFAAVMMLVVAKGYIWNNTPMDDMESVTRVYMMSFAQSPLVYTSMYLIKGAWVHFHYTYIPRTLVKTRLILHGTAVLVVVGWIVTMCIILTACLPYERIGHFQLDDTGCIPLYFQPTNVVVVTTFHVLTDVLIFTIPIALLFRLENLDTIQRISAITLFALGFIDLIFLSMNIYLNLLSYNGMIVENIYMTGTFYAIEPAWMIVVTCCPAFKVVIAKCFAYFRRSMGWEVTMVSNKGSHDSHEKNEFSPTVITRIESAYKPSTSQETNREDV